MKKRTTDAVLKPKPQKATLTPSEEEAFKTKVSEEFGGKEWYELAKAECCNFDVKFKLGYCVTLFSPCNGFRKKCSECDIGQSLKKRIEKSNNKHK